MYTLYVIPGSHACRAAMLMLEHKQLTYRRVDILTLLHPFVVRLHGFDAGGQTRTAGKHRTIGLRIGDCFGTVPALAANHERVSTNHAIARFLDSRHPEPALFPSDPVDRAAVEEAERWGNETLQMAARRIIGGFVRRDPARFSRLSANGRMGYLLYRQELARRVIVPRILRGVFAAGETAERELTAELPRMLDRIDAWIGAGVLGGEQLNAADCMIAPSLALMLYNPDLLPLFEGRPSLALVDRILPEPATTTGARADRMHASPAARSRCGRPPRSRRG